MDFDVVIVGSGVGGSAAAWSLAQAGKRILLVDAKESVASPESFQSERDLFLRREGSYREAIDINGQSLKPHLGSGPGGSSALYGAVLLRASQDDFQPGKHYSSYIDQEIWEWPFGADELTPYYETCEDMMQVAGSHEDIPAPLLKRKKNYPEKLPNLSPHNKRIKKNLDNAGHSFFELPLAIDFKKCLFCPTCPGFLCPTGAKKTGWNSFVENVTHKENLKLLLGYKALRIDHAGRKASSVHLKSMSGAKLTVTASIIIVAGGAMQTPILLKKSEIPDQSDQLGRNLMYHLGAISVGVYSDNVAQEGHPVKALGSTELYHGTDAFKHKLGYIQTIPMPGPLSVQKEMPHRLFHRFAKPLAKRSLAFALSIEDLPQPQNRVIWKEGIRIRHQFHPYDIYRGQFAQKYLKKMVRKSGALFSPALLAFDKPDHLAHQVGTARSGVDPQKSVVDSECRVHSMDNVFVCDGSVFPTSLGVGPALTIAANALRVADLIKERHL